MAAAASKPLDSDPYLRLKLVCEDPNSNCVTYESDANSIRVPANEGAFELNLDTDELHGFYYMCTRPTIKLFLSNLITCLKTVRKDSFKNDKDILPANRKWSDIVAGRSPNILETSQATYPSTYQHDHNLSIFSILHIST